LLVCMVHSSHSEGCDLAAGHGDAGIGGGYDEDGGGSCYEAVIGGGGGNKYGDGLGETSDAALREVQLVCLHI